jgi:hypothetical protein
MYKAIISPIHVRPMPGADKLQIGSCCGYQVIVGLDVQQGEVGVFFEQGGVLSEEFCRVHDLVRRKLEDGTAAGGFFEPNRRVKAIKMRGARSEGFWVPLSHLEYTGHDLSTLKAGDQFDSLNDHPICKKYVTPATERRARQNARIVRRDNKMFAKHTETEALRRAIQLIPTGALLWITEKLHGTSHRVGHVQEHEDVRIGWLRSKLIKWACSLKRDVDGTRVHLVNMPEARSVRLSQWKHINGSRNVELRDPRAEGGFYGTDAFRFKATEGIALHKGEVVYGELVGYTDTGRPIMDTQSTVNLKDKDITRQFGEVMEYAYGQPQGTCGFHVYRITRVNEDGHAVDLSWLQVMHRCTELGLKCVPLAVDGPMVYDGNQDALMALVDNLVNGASGQSALPSRLDGRHMREGVCVRVESQHGTDIYKHKAWVFGVLEGHLKEKEDYVDTEEAA